MNEAKLQCLLGRQLLLKGHSFVCPNKILRNNEADLVSINKSGFLNEFEIKLNHQDFLNEAKNKSKKHTWLTSKRAAYEKPNYYWLVCLENVINKSEIDTNYGLIYINRHNIKVVKRPKLLHKTKPDYKLQAKLARAISFKIFNRFRELIEKTSMVLE